MCVKFSGSGFSGPTGGRFGRTHYRRFGEEERSFWDNTRIILLQLWKGIKPFSLSEWKEAKWFQKVFLLVKVTSKGLPHITYVT